RRENNVVGSHLGIRGRIAFDRLCDEPSVSDHVRSGGGRGNLYTVDVKFSSRSVRGPGDVVPGPIADVGRPEDLDSGPGEGRAPGPIRIESQLNVGSSRVLIDVVAIAYRCCVDPSIDSDSRS